MSKEKHVSNVLSRFLPIEIEGFDSLAELALDMRWSWNHAADELWRQLDPALWDLTHNPWVVLQTVSPNQLEKGIEGAFPQMFYQMLTTSSIRPTVARSAYRGAPIIRTPLCSKCSSHWSCRG